ncbi:MAG: hypothetical protein ACI8P0_001391 [Planctomycetaceae bacterium]|jgi:hypothetical protein
MLHAGTCRCCDQGLLCFRICCEPRRPLIVCDECDAIWNEPDLLAAPEFASAEGSECPFCGSPIWQAPARGATLSELKQCQWESLVVGELADPQSPTDDA